MGSRWDCGGIEVGGSGIGAARLQGRKAARPRGCKAARIAVGLRWEDVGLRREGLLPAR